jgi:hypothetical protein
LGVHSCEGRKLPGNNFWGNGTFTTKVRVTRVEFSFDQLNSAGLNIKRSTERGAGPQQTGRLRIVWPQ